MTAQVDHLASVSKTGLSKDQLEAVVAFVEKEQERHIKREAKRLAHSMMIGKVTIDMIRASGGQMEYQFLGVPVTQEQYAMFMRASS